MPATRCGVCRDCRVGYHDGRMRCPYAGPFKGYVRSDGSTFTIEEVEMPKGVGYPGEMGSGGGKMGGGGGSDDGSTASANTGRESAAPAPNVKSGEGGGGKMTSPQREPGLPK